MEEEILMTIEMNVHKWTSTIPSLQKLCHVAKVIKLRLDVYGEKRGKPVYRISCPTFTARIEMWSPNEGGSEIDQIWNYLFTNAFYDPEVSDKENFKSCIGRSCSVLGGMGDFLVGSFFVKDDNIESLAEKIREVSKDEYFPNIPDQWKGYALKGEK
jgi:hypothetical protein